MADLIFHRFYTQMQHRRDLAMASALDPAQQENGATPFGELLIDDCPHSFLEDSQLQSLGGIVSLGESRRGDLWRHAFPHGTMPRQIPNDIPADA